MWTVDRNRVLRLQDENYRVRYKDRIFDFSKKLKPRKTIHGEDLLLMYKCRLIYVRILHTCS